MKIKKAVWSALLAVVMLCQMTGCSIKPDSLLTGDDIDDGPLKVTYIDVGKGDCILIQAGTFVSMIDTGYENTVDRVSAYLDREGITAIDDMIITHFDKDHYGGMIGLMERYPVRHVFLPDYESESNGYADIMTALGIQDKDDIANKYEVHIDDPGDKAILEEPVVTFVYEDTGYSIDYYEEKSFDYTIRASQTEYDTAKENDNDMSLIVTLRFSDDSYVFFGDIEKDATKEYLAREYGSRKFDIMKFPHHGDWKGNYDDLIETVSPIEVIVTDGEDRPMEDKTAEYLDKCGIGCYSTYRDGTITVHSKGIGVYGIETEYGRTK